MELTEQSLKFKKEWAWPSEVGQWLRFEVPKPSLHVCCGSSDFGDLTIDLYKKAMIRADAFHLPILSRSFQSVVCDPPWKMGVHLRGNLIYELRRVLRIGGSLFLNVPWNPQRLRGCELKLPLRVFMSNQIWGNCGLWMIYEKRTDEYDELSVSGIHHLQERLTSFQEKQTSEEILK